MLLDPEAIADAVHLMVQTAVAPVLERLASVETKVSPLADVRDRLVTVETKCIGLMDSPSVPDSVERRLAEALEKLSALQYVMNRAADHETMIADLKSRLAVAEALAAQYQELAATARQTAERLSALEAKSGIVPPAPPTDPAVLERLSGVESLRDRLVMIEAKAMTITPPPAPLAPDLSPVLDRLNDVRDRVATVEAKSAVAPAQDPAIGELRERMAVLETRAPVPGPQGPAGLNGKDGSNGVNGQDGLGFEDLDVDFNGDRTISLKFARGSVKKVFPIVLPFLRYEGVFIEGKTYVTGDLVTWGGSTWHANESTTTKPGEGSKAWTLTVKRGRDGKDGRDAEGGLPVVKTR